MNELTHLNWNSEVEREVAVGLDKKLVQLAHFGILFMNFFCMCKTQQTTRKMEFVNFD